MKSMSKFISLFMCGDVMLGRGIDQILPYSCNPQLHESYMKNAKGYVELAVQANGPIPENRDEKYIWGALLDTFGKENPDVNIINLETSITTSDDYWVGKGIHYRMHPKNNIVLKAAGIDCCALANNHILDWGYAGLIETLKTLKESNIKYAGAGMNQKEAEAPAIFDIPNKGRVIVFSYGNEDSGCFPEWKATNEKPGINYIEYDEKNLQRIKENVKMVKKENDIVIASIHWGGNWGYNVPKYHREFAHRLIDDANVDLIHGHSSHHIKGMEVYKNKLIIYGCGDFLTDYEGILGYEGQIFRDDLGLAYFPILDPKTGNLIKLKMYPTRVKNLRINVPSKEEVDWIIGTLNREGEKFNLRVVREEDYLNLIWE